MHTPRRWIRPYAPVAAGASGALGAPRQLRRCSRAPAGTTTLLLYYSTTLLFYDSTALLLYYSTTLLLYYSTTLLFYYSTTLLLYYSTTTLLRYYATTLSHYYSTAQALLSRSGLYGALARVRRSLRQTCVVAALSFGLGGPLVYSLPSVLLQSALRNVGVLAFSSYLALVANQ